MPVQTINRRPLRWLLLPLLLAFTGCSTRHSIESAQSAVQAMGRFELDCDEVQLVKLGEAAELFGTYDQLFGAQGCGRRGIYLVSCANGFCSVEVE